MYSCSIQSPESSRSGFAVVELLVAIFVVALLSVATFNLATLGIRTAIVTEYRSVAQGIATSEIERVNHLTYENVRLDDGSVPDGLMSPTDQISQNGQTYDIVRAVTLVDDPQNGTLSETLDEDNADYKQVTITATPPNEPDQNVTFTTLVVRQIPPVDLPVPVAYWSYNDVEGWESCFQGDSRTIDDVGSLDGVIEGNTSCADWPTSVWPPLLGETPYFVYGGQGNGNFSQFGSQFVPVSPPITFTSSYTIAAWINPNPLPSVNKSGLVTYNNNLQFKDSGTFEWYLTKAGGIELLLTDNGSDCDDPTARHTFSDANQSFISNQWQHVAVVYDSAGKTVQHFIDGVPGQPLDVSFAAKACGAPSFFAIGSLLDARKQGFNPVYPVVRPQNFYRGSMDDLRIYDQVLAEDQIRWLAQGNS